MTFLSAISSASIRLVSRKPTAVFSANDSFSLEMTDLANEVARDILKSHEWQALTNLETMTGDGVLQGFPLPSDYDRMLLTGEVHSQEWASWNYTKCPNLSRWRSLLDWEANLSPGWWIILQNQIQFQPPLPEGEVAKYYYISKNYARASQGEVKPAFTADTDEFILDERLLTLGLIYKWREMKGIPRPGDREDFEQALSEAQARDGGPNVMRQGRINYPPGVHHAWPHSLGPGTY